MVPSKITTIGAVSNNGVGDVKGAVGEIDSTTVVVCRISREGGIGECEGAACMVKNSTTVELCRIAVQGGIGKNYRATGIGDAGTLGGSIARYGRISDVKIAGSVVPECASDSELASSGIT